MSIYMYDPIHFPHRPSSNLFIGNDLELVLGLVHTFFGSTDANGIAGFVGTGHVDLGGSRQLNGLETTALFAKNSFVMLLRYLKLRCELLE